MTAQIGELLDYDGEFHIMHTEPLEDYFDACGSRPDFDLITTACWRGYIGIWKIISDRLYLVGFNDDPEPQLEDGTKVILNTLFPAQGDQIFAGWYSGALKIPEGEMLRYIHGGYGSIFERDRFLEIEKGVLLKTKVQTNSIKSS